MTDGFFRRKPLSSRKQWFDKISTRHPSSVPVIVSAPEGFPSEKKFICPRDMDVRSLMVQARKYMGLESGDTFYLSSEIGYIIRPEETLGFAWNKYHSHEDGFLYLILHKEACFG